MTDREQDRAAVVACHACGGSGCFDWQAVICCGNVLPSGECCSMPVAEHRRDPCEDCNGTGLFRAIERGDHLTDRPAP
jgi:hypothetical protein